MKRVGLVLALLVVGSAALADDKPKDGRNARDAMEGWVAAVLAGKVEEANALAAPREREVTGETMVKGFKEWLGVGSLKIATVYVSDKKGRAVGVSEAVKFKKLPPGADDPNPDVLSLELEKVKGKWLLTKFEFKSAAGAGKQVGRFRSDYLDAQVLPPKSKK